MIDLEKVLEFIESEEMRDYLRETLPKSRAVLSSCADIVAYAPAPIERKLPLLEQIAHYADAAPDKTEPWEARFTRVCRAALEERYSGSAGAVFWLQDYYSNERGYYFCDAFFTGFDAALDFLAKEAEKDPESFLDPQVSYTITKLIPGIGAQFKEYCVWYLNNTRELWYFDYCSNELLLSQSALIDYRGADLNLPIPFEPGDIVTVDCLPYALPRRVLIVEIGDNHDCCCVQALSIHENGRLRVGAFKHNMFFDRETSLVSGLYRARRYDGPLTDEEEPFAVLSPLLKERPDLGAKIPSCMWKSERSDVGFTWSMLKLALETEILDQNWEDADN